VSAYYLSRWGNDEARDNSGNDIVDCPTSPPPPPPPPTYSQWWVDTFANAPVFDGPWSGNATGTLYAGTNYVYCKALGRDIGDGSAHNHWWLYTDPDEGPGGQWVSAYCLTRWGDDEAYDNNGTEIPDC
jgi:hypothetical protein